MTHRVAEQFALLLGDRRAKGATGLLTRRTAVTSQLGSVLLGVDADANRHLLVPIDAQSCVDTRISRGVNLSSRELVVRDESILYADLHCTVARLSKPFERLVEDILGRLARRPEDGLTAVTTALDDWRALLRRGMDGLTREEVVGLIGELEILALLAGSNPVAAVEGWTGPDMQIHDFRSRGHDIEVKATAAVTPTSVRIANLDQLDPALSVSLHLAVVHLMEASDAPDINDRVETLLGLGVPAGALEDRLELYGYVHDAPLQVPSRFALRNVSWWEVDSGFPGLRASDLPPDRLLGVDAVTYGLALSALPPALVPDDVRSLLERWCG